VVEPGGREVLPVLEEADAVDAVVGVPAGRLVADGPQGEVRGVVEPQGTVVAAGGEDLAVGRERDRPDALLQRDGLPDLPGFAVPDADLALGGGLAVGGDEGLAVRGGGDGPHG